MLAGGGKMSETLLTPFIAHWQLKQEPYETKDSRIRTRGKDRDDKIKFLWDLFQADLRLKIINNNNKVPL